VDGPILKEETMQDKEKLKEAICHEIDKGRSGAEAIADRILHEPELGFKEFATAQVVADKFKSLQIPHRTGLAITGVKGTLDTGRPGPTAAILGELDSIIVYGHPHANRETGAAHACGHNVQIATLLAVAEALSTTDAISALSGRIVLFAVPAEEYVEVEYRMELAKQGKIEFLGGKPELIRLGEFDDIDMAMMTHLTVRPQERKMAMIDSCNGCIVKQIQFLGKASHAGAAPDQGINALNAAMVALNAIHAQRETFRDADTVRIHPIITRGGDLVNVVPADVRMETFVRAKTAEAIEDADAKLNRALRAGSIAVGGKAKVTTLPGYMPLANDKPLASIFKENALSLIDAADYVEGGHLTGSTDMGDVANIMPAIHPFAGGATGTSHGGDFTAADMETACMAPAKAMAMTAVDLLYGDAKVGRDLIGASKPPMTKEAYLAFLRKMNNVVVYEE
jgi:amidohydrolase